MTVIPKQFDIMGFTVKVLVTNRLDSDRDGEWSPSEGVIRVRKGLSADRLGQVFLHELTHCILEFQSYEELNKDEDFVDRFAQCLYQIQKTMKGGHAL